MRPLLLILLAACEDRAARCLGWCEAHGYERAVYLDEIPTNFDVYEQRECWCALRVGPDVATVGAPIESPSPEPLPAEAPPSGETP